MPLVYSSALSKRIAILGSTGSIGTSALEVLEHLGSDYRAVALSARSQLDKLVQQVHKHRPVAVAVPADADPAICKEIERLGAKIYGGEQGLVEIAQREDVDLVLSAIVGAAGLPATLAAVRAGKPLALANKESLVVAGKLLLEEAKAKNVTILPVDSEHSAIFQAMHAGRREEIERVILTASGGPFRTFSVEQIERAKPAEALAHPTWRMGNKITIDSATMFNKGLELIEACWLFDLPPAKVQVVIHPESVIHSMVEFVDGSTLAQMSPPDMKTPIQYALTYPERKKGCGRRMNFSQPQTLHFEPPDRSKFPALAVAYDVAERAGTLGAVMNGANEAAVASFLSGNIGFGEICRVVELTIRGHDVQPVSSLDDLIEADQWARATAKHLISQRVKSKV